MFGFVPGVLAQPAVNAWFTTISFSGSGSLPVNEDTTFGGAGYPDPILSASLTGTGVDTAVADGFGGFYVNRFFDTIASITMPDAVAPSVSPFSVTAPRVGADPGLPLTTPQTDIPSAGGPPFYGLFPPPPGTDYSDTIASTLQHNFQYDPTEVLFVKFNGEADLILGPAPTLNATPDPSLPGDDIYTSTYDDSELRLSATIGENDPGVDFKGTVVITTIAAAPAPDSSPGLPGVLTLLAVCASGARRKAREA